MASIALEIKRIDDLTNELLWIADVLETHQVNVKLDDGTYLNPVLGIRTMVEEIWNCVAGIRHEWNTATEGMV